MATKEMEQVLLLRDAEAIRADRDAKLLAPRRAFELANMSPYIAERDWLSCITQTTVGIIADVDGTFLVDVHPTEAATKPTGAVRVVLDTTTGLKTVKAQQPPEKPIDVVKAGEAVAEAVK